MWKKLALGGLGLWIMTLMVAGYFFVRGTAITGDDGRQVIKLKKEERNLVLNEMRLLLEGVQTILEASTTNDFKIIEQTASSIGMKAAADVNPRLMAKLPLDFKSLGMEVHQRFDQLAIKVNEGMKKDEVIKEVSDIMLNCVSCHQAYRLDEVN